MYLLVVKICFPSVKWDGTSETESRAQIALEQWLIYNEGINNSTLHILLAILAVADNVASEKVD